MNGYERAFVERFERLNIGDVDFPILAREALEAKYGGQIGVLLANMGESASASPRRYAEVLFDIFGVTAMQYYLTILKYAESGRFQPRERLELEKRERMLEEIIRGPAPRFGQEEADATKCEGNRLDAWMRP